MTSAELRKRFGQYQEAAQNEPVSITSDDQGGLVLLSAKEYERLKRRDREVRRVEDMGEDFLQALATAEVPAEHAHLDAELGDWRP
ncbi:type II toxin-antitoxin system Phd/YefM family antitoxin [Allostella humosa]|uniref:type II toxin-antitoxin system Phd/YefM family antitoxin n=1 Tax=Stella humosa TaxID=94 RepID=UPI0018D8CF9D|nr:type II toxin-antitoxin system Phd/YefM family antitoxin [Stella humosa]